MGEADQRIDEEEPSPEDRLIQLLWAYDEGVATGSQVGDSTSTESNAGLDAETSERLEQDRAAIDLLSWAGPSLEAASSADRENQTAARSTSAASTNGHDRLPADPTDALCEAIVGGCFGSTELPRRFGRFEILRELGRGGLGVVLLADDPVLKRKVALKIPRPEVLMTSDLRRRFEREAQAAARLTHPNLIAVYEVGEVGPVAYIAAAYCHGPNLSEWLAARKEPVPARMAAEIVARLADGMEYAHQQGVLHRDLKPSNILLETPDGVTCELRPMTELDVDLPFTPKITDFGLARIEDLAGGETRAGLVMGTPAYMSPEQAEGRLQDIGRAMDVFALGAILYELLAGQPAFKGAGDADTLLRVTSEEPGSLSRTVRKVPRDLGAICLKCLEKDPKKRYATTGALAADLNRFLAGLPTEARPPAMTERVAKWSRRKPALAALLGIGTLAAAVVVAMTVVYVGWLQQANDAAQAARTEAETSAAQAQTQERIANQYLYASQMKLAYQSLDQGEVQQATELLDRYKPGTSLANMRSFEWYHLKRRLHGERLTLTGHQGEVYAVTFSPDGRQVVSGGQDGTIRFWDAESGTPLKTVAAHKSCVNAVVYAPGGSILASASCDHMVKLWDATTLQLLDTLEGHQDEVHCLAFCPNNANLLAAGGHEPIVRIWELATREIVRTFDVGGDVNGLAWRVDGQAIFAAGATLHTTEPRTFSWHLDDGRMESYPWNTNSVAASSRGDVCWGSKGATIHLGTGADSQPLMLTGGTSRIEAVAFSRSGDQFASAGADRTIRIWDTARNDCKQVFTGHAARVQSLAFSPRDSTLASASFDGTIKLWNDEPTDRTVRTAAACVTSRSPGLVVAISSDFRYLALQSTLREVRVYRLDDGSLAGVLQLADYIRGLQFLPDRPVLFGAAVQTEHSVDWWDVDKWKSIQTYRLPDGTLYGQALYGQFLVTEHATATHLTDTSTRKKSQEIAKLRHLDGSSYILPSEFVFSPDGSTLAISRQVPEPTWIIERFDATTSRQAVGQIQAISNGGTFFVRPFDHYSVALIDSQSGRQLAVLRHPDAVGDIAFSPDRKTLAVCCGEHTVFLWNVASGQEIARLLAGPGKLLKVQFSSDGRRLVAVTRDNIKQKNIEYTYQGGTKVSSVEESTAVITIWSGVEGP